jgi:acylaminoacyl-peptidase
MLALAGALTCGTTYAEKTPITAIDLFNFERAQDPRISPKGSTIVYVRQFCDIMTDARCSNLWTVDFDGSDHRPLTSGHHHDRSPRWAPDGKRLLYISDKDGSPQIYLRWMDTGQTARLTNLQYPPSGIGWSPDGTMISFSGFVPSEPRTIAEMPPAPPKAEWATPPRVIDTLTYRFDSHGYLEPGYHHVFVMPAEPGTPRRISSGDFNHGYLFGGATPVWTPDSKYLLVAANRHPNHEHDPLNTEIYEFSVADGSVKALTDRQGPDDSPAVSPDGELIAYVGFDDNYQGYQLRRLYIMNRDGSEPRVLSGDFDRSVGGWSRDDLRWAANGSGVYFTYTDHGNTKLGFFTRDGSLQTLAENIGGAWASAYGGGSFTVSNGGRFAFNTTRADKPVDIAVGSRGVSSLRVVTAINDDLLAQRKLSPAEEIWYTSSKDNRQIHGWIIKPPDFDASKKYPLILEIHGGPFANYGDRFDIEKQLYAANGYVVLYTNPRGSTSYGEHFGNLIHHAYPGDDYYDLISGVDALVANGYIDSDNVFVTGGSGGGILTCWLIGKTDRFRAAASLYPVINWYSIALTTDISVFMHKYWFPGLPWETPDDYINRSPLSLMGNVKTPTLVMTGEEDYRTPISEAEQYYKALKMLEIDSAFVRVPGEAHGIRGRPSHQIAKVLNVVGWFDEHRTATDDEG